MSYTEEDFLQLSGIQHFAFCRRQWALIHIEKQWAEYIRTVEGRILHERAHDTAIRERRGDLLTDRGLSIRFYYLGDHYQSKIEHYGAKETYEPTGILMI